MLKEAAARAIRDDINQYAITWGAHRLRGCAGPEVRRARYGLEADPEREITVTCGATEAMIATLLAVVNPGDEVIVFEPFYENYGPDTILADAKPVYVPLEPGQPLDLDRLAAAFSPRTRAIIVNTPSNPSGRVLTPGRARGDRASSASRTTRWRSPTRSTSTSGSTAASTSPSPRCPGMRERTVTISGASKTFSVTGWRIGWILAPADLTDAIRKVHDFLTVGAPAPLQEGVAVALERLDDAFYTRPRDRLPGAARPAASRRWWRRASAALTPEGAYYILADFSDLADSARGDGPRSTTPRSPSGSPARSG